jgi:hypothetical protein
MANIERKRGGNSVDLKKAKNKAGFERLKDENLAATSANLTQQKTGMKLDKLRATALIAPDSSVSDVAKPTENFFQKNLGLSGVGATSAAALVAVVTTEKELGWGEKWEFVKNMWSVLSEKIGGIFPNVVGRLDNFFSGKFGLFAKRDKYEKVTLSGESPMLESVEALKVPKKILKERNILVKKYEIENISSEHCQIADISKNTLWIFDGGKVSSIPMNTSKKRDWVCKGVK